MPKQTPIDAYLDDCAEDARRVLIRIREIVREASPDAEEVLSYRMPAWKQNGILIYAGAFKKHIGLYPPVTGDADLVAEAGPYSGPKGNLKFPLDKPIPYDLIQRIVAARVVPNASKA